jgi:hypothetical protein
MQGVPKIALKLYSKCYCVASVTKTFTPEGVQTIERWIVASYTNCSEIYYNIFVSVVK